MIRKAFLSGEFERLLRRLNPDLRVYCGDDESRPAGLFRVKEGRIEELGGVDKGMIPDKSVMAKSGRVLKKGWRSTIKDLLGRGVVRPKDVRRLLPEYYDTTEPFSHTIEPREIDKAIEHFKNKRPLGKFGGPVYTRKDLMEIGDAFHG